MSKDYYGVYAEGVKNLDAELADMAKTDLRDYSFRTSRWPSRIRKWLSLRTKRRCRRLRPAMTCPAHTTAEVFGFSRAANGSAPFTLKARRSKFDGPISEVRTYRSTV